MNGRYTRAFALKRYISKLSTKKIWCRHPELTNTAVLLQAIGSSMTHDIIFICSMSHEWL
ncbi:hypothetical protein T05_5459 [Trichinella murrelli]|uniref:Uncharacterized protein n=1 Tax=Trichinella murrelli TaxID=144512 RepID=A0A0V0TG60_9BILA|nr:hypothetical protein T05_5459 [Trichinella murrelli]